MIEDRLKKLVITGGTGSLGNAIVERISQDATIKTWFRKVIIFSRDEYKQSLMAEKFKALAYMRYLLGDVRDLGRLKQVLNGVDYVIHAAALKQIPALEYNPTEAVKTNINGTMNVIESCLDCGVKRAIFISTDKAVNPINLYGATKLVGEKLFIAANSYNKTDFRVVRYGNVLSSRGSIIETFLNLKAKGIKVFPITDERMTRFWITLEEAAKMVINAIETEKDGHIYIPRIPSMKITDIAKAIEPDCTFKIIGIRQGEKLHEVLISKDERVILMPEGQVMGELSSENNPIWMTQEELKTKLQIV